MDSKQYMHWLFLLQTRYNLQYAVTSYHIFGYHTYYYKKCSIFVRIPISNICIIFQFSSPLNYPLRGPNGIHEGVASENHCLLEGQVEAKDYDTDRTEVTSLHTQYKNQHGKNEQEIRSERVQHW